MSGACGDGDAAVRPAAKATSEADSGEKAPAPVPLSERGLQDPAPGRLGHVGAGGRSGPGGIRLPPLIYLFITDPPGRRSAMGHPRVLPPPRLRATIATPGTTTAGPAQSSRPLRAPSPEPPAAGGVPAAPLPSWSGSGPSGTQPGGLRGTRPGGRPRCGVIWRRHRPELDGGSGWGEIPLMRHIRLPLCPRCLDYFRMRTGSCFLKSSSAPAAPASPLRSRSDATGPGARRPPAPHPPRCPPCTGHPRAPRPRTHGMEAAGSGAARGRPQTSSLALNQRVPERPGRAPCPSPPTLIAAPWGGGHGERPPPSLAGPSPCPTQHLGTAQGSDARPGQRTRDAQHLSPAPCAPQALTRTRLPRSPPST